MSSDLVSNASPWRTDSREESYQQYPPQPQQTILAGMRNPNTISAQQLQAQQQYHQQMLLQQQRQQPVEFDAGESPHESYGDPEDMPDDDIHSSSNSNSPLVRSASPSSTLALTAITDAAFNPDLADLSVAITKGVDVNVHAPPSSFALPTSVSLTTSFDPFPALNATTTHSGTEYAPAASSLDYSVNAAGEQETPADILHYYQSFAEARRQIVCQSLAVVRLYSQSWHKMSIVARDQAMKKRLVRPRESTASGVRQSTLAASYMSMVAAQQQQQEAQAAAQAAANAALEATAEEGEFDASTASSSTDRSALSSRERKSSASPSRPSSEAKHARTPSGNALTVSVGVASSAGATASTTATAAAAAAKNLNTSDMEKAVQTAHQAKLAKEAEEEERKRAELEEARYQQSIAYAQAKLETDPGMAIGESRYMHLQEENKTVPSAPLRVGIIGCGSLGYLIAEQILEQLCGMPKDSSSNRGDNAAAARRMPPSVPTTPAGVRLFISTRRPDMPHISRLIKRAGGSGGAAGTHGQNTLLTVYFDNARLISECNVVLICTLPHQLQLLSSTIRSLSPKLQPRSQLFFSITSSHSSRALKNLLGSNSCATRTSLVLPHLMLKGSTAARDAHNQFLDSVFDATKHSFACQASYRTLLGSDGIARVVDGGRREVESEIRKCFFQPNQDSRPDSGYLVSHVAQPTAAASASGGEYHQDWSQSAHSSVRSTAHMESRQLDSPSHHTSYFSQSSRTTGLSSSPYTARVGGLPKLKDIQQQQQQKEESKEGLRPRTGGSMTGSLNPSPYPPSLVHTLPAIKRIMGDK